MIPALLLLVLLVTVGIGLVLARAATTAHSSESAPSTGQSVRRFFQYLLMSGLALGATNGLTGLLGRLLDPGRELVRDDALLALQLTLVLIALPLWAALAWWTWRRQRADVAEVSSVGWLFYLTFVGVISLVVAMVGWYRTLSPLVGPEPWQPDGLAQALVWTLVWAGHHWWGHRVTPADRLVPLRLLSSAIGLVTFAGGLVATTAPALREVLGLAGESMVGGSAPTILDGAVVLAIGAVVWGWSWLRDAVHLPRSTAWLGLVLLLGVGGGLLLALIAASTFGYDVLVWLVGDPAADSAREHFAAVPTQLACTLTGGLLWWYHQEVLDTRRSGARTEVRRIYEYLMSAIGLAAAGAGLVMVLVTIVEALAAGSDLVVGGRAINALLGALVLLVVGVPVWLRHWRLAQAAREASPEDEVGSPVRRLYLLVLFGVMGVVAVVALLILVNLVLRDVLEGGLDVETLRRVRFAVGVLVTTGLISAYHWNVFRTDREIVPAPTATVPHDPARSQRALLLVGAADPSVVAALREATGAHVQLITRTDTSPGAWSVDELMAAVQAAPDGDLLLLADPEGLQVIPVRR